MKVLFFTLFFVVGVAVSSRNCTKPEIVASTDPNKFVVCSEHKGAMLTTEHECSKGLVFDIWRKSCTVPRITALFENGVFYGNDSTYTYYDTTSTNYPERMIGSTAAPAPVPLPCQSPGAMCDTCNTLSFCVGSSKFSDLFRKILTLECEPGSVCVTKQGCVLKSSGGLCRQGNFRCGDIGTYPDLYDCTKYHTCSLDSNGRLVDEEGQCAGGLYGNRWSPENSQCGWTENVEACRGYPVPVCSRELEMGSVGGQVYYICIVDKKSHTLSPTLFRCPMIYTFDPTTFRCTITPKLI